METSLDLKVFGEGSRLGLIPTPHGRVVVIQTFDKFGGHTHEEEIVPGFYRSKKPLPLTERGGCSEGLRVDTVPEEQQDAVSRTLRTFGYEARIHYWGGTKPISSSLPVWKRPW